MNQQDAQILKFPKVAKSTSQNKKAANILSIASLLVLSLFSNQWLVQRGGSQNGVELASTMPQSRGIASVGESIAEVTQNLSIEKELAEQMATDLGDSTVALAEKPNLKDELIFGELEGKYAFRVEDGKIESLTFIGQRDSQEKGILKIADKVAFLKKYESIFSASYSQVERSIDSENSATETFHLFDKNHTLVGAAKFSVDSQGHLLQLKFSR